MARRPPPRRFFELFLATWLPVLAYVALIAFVSSQPNLHPPVSFTFSDKLAHVAEYFVLGVLLWRALVASAPDASLRSIGFGTIGLGVLIAIGDEFLQSFIPGRVSGAADVVADAIGVIVARFVYPRFTRKDVT